MPTMEVISVNLWQILISLCNLVLLFLILKKFLFKPVKKAMAERKEAVEREYYEAKQAKSDALEQKKAWEEKMESAENRADAVLQTAVEQANMRSDAILAETREKADDMIRQAKKQVELEQKKARAAMQHEIVDVSTMLSEKLLGREINAEDHRDLIDSFIEKIGEDDGTQE